MDDGAFVDVVDGGEDALFEFQLGGDADASATSGLHLPTRNGGRWRGWRPKELSVKPEDPVLSRAALP